jgi:hypothetical protein
MPHEAVAAATHPFADCRSAHEPSGSRWLNAVMCVYALTFAGERLPVFTGILPPRSTGGPAPRAPAASARGDSAHAAARV